MLFLAFKQHRRWDSPGVLPLCIPHLHYFHDSSQDSSSPSLSRSRSARRHRLSQYGSCIARQHYKISGAVYVSVFLPPLSPFMLCEILNQYGNGQLFQVSCDQWCTVPCSFHILHYLYRALVGKEQVNVHHLHLHSSKNYHCHF